jgi:hypothetical protein
MEGVRKALPAHLIAVKSGDDLGVDIPRLELHKAIWDMAGSTTLPRPGRWSVPRSRSP